MFGAIWTIPEYKRVLRVSPEQSASWDIYLSRLWDTIFPFKHYVNLGKAQRRFVRHISERLSLLHEETSCQTKSVKPPWVLTSPLSIIEQLMVLLWWCYNDNNNNYYYQFCALNAYFKLCVCFKIRLVFKDGWTTEWSEQQAKQHHPFDIWAKIKETLPSNRGPIWGITRAG